MKKLPLKLKFFLVFTWVITLFSFLFFWNSGYIKYDLPSYGDIVFFIILMALTESVMVSFNDLSFSTSFAVQLASYMLFGPLTTIIVIIVGFSFRIAKNNNTYRHIFNTPWYGILFNYCTLCLPVIWGNYVYQVLGSTYPVNYTITNLMEIFLFSLVYFFVNILIIAVLLSINTKKSFWYCLVSNSKLTILNIFVMIPFGIILALFYNRYGYFGVSLALFPILLAKYTFSLYIDSKNQYIQTVNAFMNAIEARDEYTEGHSQRVAEISEMIARELKYNQKKIEQLNIAAMLHDIGKIGIKDDILNKPGKLTKEEFDIIKSHPDIGCKIIKDVKNLEYAQSIIRHHHERYDGNGYPDSKKADELSLDVFIVQLADSIDAMSTDRPYRKALSQEKIMEEINNNVGTQFHPKVVEAYFKATKGNINVK